MPVKKENVLEECSVLLHWLEVNLALMQRVWAKKKWRFSDLLSPQNQILL